MTQNDWGPSSFMASHQMNMADYRNVSSAFIRAFRKYFEDIEKFYETK